MRILPVIVSLLGLLFTLPATQADEPVRIRVLSYNIHHCEGTDRSLDLPRIAKVIRSVSPDLVSLQEVDKKTARSDSVDQPAELARLTEMKVVFGANIQLQGGEYGNAILSKWDFASSTNMLLRSFNDGEQRGLLSATAKVRTDKVVRFLATHFDHRRAADERLAAAAGINAMVTGKSQPTILAGDINATRSSQVLKDLQQEWRIAGEQEQPTIPSNTPRRQIDFILFRPADRWRVIETKVLPEAVASDHRAILAVLELVGAKAKAESRLPHDQPILVRGSDGSSMPAESTAQWNSRRESIVAAMHSVMGDFPANLSRDTPRHQVIEEFDCQSYIRRLIEYESQSGCMTPAYLCIPKSALADNPKQVAAVLCLHPTDNTNGHKVVMGLGGRANRQYAAELAERGYVTIAPSYPLLANYQPDIKTLGWQSGTLKAVWDNMRAIDLLQSLPFVAKEKIGAIGHSLGGHNSVYTAVFDPRIKAIVSSCGLDSYRDYYQADPKVWVRGKGWTSDRYMPRLADYAGRLAEIPFDFHEMIAALAPRHTLIVAPLHDGNFRAGSVDRVAASAREVFELHKAGANLQVEHPDCDHDFPNEMRETAYKMFDQVLKD